MKYIILLNVLVWGSAIAALPDAIDTGNANAQVVVEISKDDNRVKTDSDNDAYYASDEYKMAKWANDFIAKNRGDL